MSQTFKPKTDVAGTGFINELGDSIPLWSSVDEGLTVPTDSDFIEVEDPIETGTDDNVAFVSFGSSIPRFNTSKMDSVKGKIRIDTNAVATTVSLRFYDKDFAHVIASTIETINTATFTDFIFDMKINNTSKPSWNLDESNIFVSITGDDADIDGMQISVFEVEVITVQDCIVRRIPQADAEFFTPSTWENELNVNHKLWKSVATSGDARFVKTLSGASTEDISFHYQGVAKIPESGLFSYRAKNNGTDDSTVDFIKLYDNLTNKVVGSGFTSDSLTGSYVNYTVPILFLQTGFLPSAAYTVETDISAAGGNGVVDTEFSTQSIALYMPNSYCCIPQGNADGTVNPALVALTDPAIEQHNFDHYLHVDTSSETIRNDLYRFLISDDPSADNGKPLTQGLPDPTIVRSIFTTLQEPWTEEPNIPDRGLYIQFEPFVSRPDTITVEFAFTTQTGTDDIDFTVQLVDGLVTIPLGDPNHLVTLQISGLIPVGAGEVDQLYYQSLVFQLGSLTNEQWDAFKDGPMFRIAGQDVQDFPAFLDVNTGIEISALKFTYLTTKFTQTCTQFLYPKDDLNELYDGVWVDNVGNPASKNWDTINRGVSTFNDNRFMTYASQIGQTDFPGVGFEVDQMTIDPTSVKLNFRGGGIEPSGGVSSTMILASLYDTDGLVVAANLSTPISNISGDMRSYTVDMKIAQGNRELWNLNQPQLQLIFFSEFKDLRFSEVEIEACGTCPDRDTANITLFLENLEDCQPEQTLRPNEDIDILTSGEWAFCGEFSAETEIAWPCIDDEVFAAGDPDKISMKSISVNRPTTMYWTEKGFGAANPHITPQTQDMAIKSSNMTGGDIVTLLETPAVESPDNLVVDWIYDYLYFTESGSVALQRCDLDGGNLTTIADITDLTVEDMFIDFKERRLYFTTANSGTIEYLNIPSGGIPVNWATGFSHPVGLWKYQSNMYVTDVEDNAIYTTTGGASKTLVVGGLNTPSGLVGDNCEGTLFVSNFANNGDITRLSIANPVPLIIASSILPHDLTLDSRKGLLYFTEYNDVLPFNNDQGKIRRVQVDGDGLVSLVPSLNLPQKLTIDTTDVETHTSTLRFGLTDLNQCCLAVESGFVSIKAAEVSTPITVDSFAYIKAQVVNPSGDILWKPTDDIAKIDDLGGLIQQKNIGFSNQASNPNFASPTNWADAILQLDIEQFLQPVLPTGFGCPVLNAEFDLYAAQFNVTACSGIEDNDNITLFIQGSGDLSNVMTLYTRSGFVDSAADPFTLFVQNLALPINTDINLFTSGLGGPSNSSIDLFMGAPTKFSNLDNVVPQRFLDEIDDIQDQIANLPPFDEGESLFERLDELLKIVADFDPVFTLFTTSFVETSGDMNLFISGDGFNTSNDTMNLFTKLDFGEITDTTTLFVETLLSNNSNFDLSILSFLETSGNMNLVMSGSIGPPIDTTMNLFLSQGDITPSGQFSLFITTPVTNSGDFTLFTQASTLDSGNMNLFIDSTNGAFTVDLFLANKAVTDNMNLVIIGPDGNFVDNNPKLFIHGATISGQFASTPLFMEVDTAFNANMNLFIKGPAFNELTSNINLFTGGFGAKGGPELFIANNNAGLDDNKTLFIGGPPTAPHSGNMNLFMGREYESALRSVTLFVDVPTQITNNTELTISGGQDITDNITLFNAGGIDQSSGIPELYTHGF